MKKSIIAAGLLALFSTTAHPSLTILRRTPQGVRGLKPDKGNTEDLNATSHSARSAWIETSPYKRWNSVVHVALRKECVD